MPTPSHEGEFYLDNDNGVPTLIFTLLGDQQDGNVEFKFDASYTDATQPDTRSGKLKYVGGNEVYERIEPFPPNVEYHRRLKIAEPDGFVPHPVLKFPLQHDSLISGEFSLAFAGEGSADPGGPDLDTIYFQIANAKAETQLSVSGATLQWPSSTDETQYVAMIYGYETPKPILRSDQLDSGRVLLLRYHKTVSVSNTNRVPGDKDTLSNGVLSINVEQLFEQLNGEDDEEYHPRCSINDCNLQFSPVTYRNRHLMDGQQPGGPNDLRSPLGKVKDAVDVNNQFVVGQQGAALAMGFYIVAEKCAQAQQSSQQKPTSELVDVNYAKIDELSTLPGIGMVKAQNIIDERELQLFTSIEDLLRVDGIGEKTLEQIRSRITITV